MTNRDVEILLRFILRTGMFITEVKKGCIASFVDGYDIARNGKCDFSGQISELLENEFNIKRQATGWPGQITAFGTKQKLSWESAFKKIGLRVLSKSFLGKSKKKFEKTIKSAIHSKIDHIRDQTEKVNWFGEWWINEWSGIVALEENWFQEIWTDRELELISKINSQIAMIENKNQEKIVANKQLIDLVKEFKKVSSV